MSNVLDVIGQLLDNCLSNVADSLVLDTDSRDALIQACNLGVPPEEVVRLGIAAAQWGASEEDLHEALRDWTAKN